mmetsp:Transcript_53319/g.134710  ORF Transcript_53319/g.134710 Transcript_53319/m.134710 type:complete len:344 (+) Transcript_53319:49-1080(+)
MAAFSSALPPCMLNDSDGPSVCRVVSVAASQADRSISEKLPEISRRLSRSSTRLGSWAKQSSLSTWSAADEDSEWETLDSPRDFGSVVGRVQVLSHSRDGSLQVRDALDQAPLMDRMLLVQEMHGHTLRAMRCPHANHVLQKIISIMPQASLQFIVDEIMQYKGMARKMAMHEYSSSIIKKLLERCEESQVGRLIEVLLQDTPALSCHAYGNFVIQHLLRFGTAQQQYRCLRAIEQNMGRIARSEFGVCVVTTAMKHASSHDRVWTARAVLVDPRLLLQMAQLQDGGKAVLLVLSSLPEQECAQACRRLVEAADELHASECGKQIMADLEASGLDIVDAMGKC